MPYLAGCGASPPPHAQRFGAVHVEQKFDQIKDAEQPALHALRGRLEQALVAFLDHTDRLAEHTTRLDRLADRLFGQGPQLEQTAEKAGPRNEPIAALDVLHEVAGRIELANGRFYEMNSRLYDAVRRLETLA